MAQGHLACNENTAALLASYLVQGNWSVLILLPSDLSFFFSPGRRNRVLRRFSCSSLLFCVWTYHLREKNFTGTSGRFSRSAVVLIKQFESMVSCWMSLCHWFVFEISGMRWLRFGGLSGSFLPLCLQVCPSSRRRTRATDHGEPQETQVGLPKTIVATTLPLFYPFFSRINFQTKLNLRIDYRCAYAK
jgi:hypothetical protein